MSREWETNGCERRGSHGSVVMDRCLQRSIRIYFVMPTVTRLQDEWGGGIIGIVRDISEQTLIGVCRELAKCTTPTEGLSRRNSQQSSCTTNFIARPLKKGLNIFSPTGSLNSVHEKFNTMKEILNIAYVIV